MYLGTEVFFKRLVSYEVSPEKEKTFYKIIKILLGECLANEKDNTFIRVI
jgi:hypothetical protein